MWLAPLFLLGLAGLAVPLWLHRFAKQTDQKQPFASLMFLEASEIRRSRHHQLRYWLLLALRLLLVLLMVLAFAGPLWRAPARTGAAGATLHVIVVDTSLSMRTAGVWERARERAGELIGTVRGADRMMLVAADHRMRILREPGFASDAGPMRAALATIEPGESRLDYGTLSSGAAAWNGGPGEKVLVHLVTDLQASASPLRFADLQLPAGMQLDLVDAGADSHANLRVASVGVAEQNDRQAVVRIDGDAAALAGRTLVLELNGVERGRRMLDAKAKLPDVQRFELGELGPGEHRLAARLVPADDLAVDDAYFSLIRRVQPKVLLVAASASGDDATYLRAALQALAEPRFDVDVALPAALATRALGEFAAVVVSDAGLLTGAPLQALRKYVEGGGAALLTLGPRALQQQAVPLGGATLARGRARSAGDTAVRVADVEQSHPVLREPGAWRSIRFFRHVPVVAPDDAQVLLRFENGSPLLFEQAVGKGRLLTFASPLDRDWNDLAIHPLFVRFVAESTAYLAGARAAPAMAMVGSAFDSDLARRGAGQVFDPRGKRTMMLDGTQAGPRLVPDMTGYYEVRGGGRSDFIAVNVDPRESQLARLDADSRARWLALQGDRSAGRPVAQVAAAAPAPRLIPVWFWLLLAAAALAFMEPLVANYHLHVQRERRT
ncbi:MAG TPA: BatA domain-containing protein [Steroidobacteraceae bacterium]|nr:BatA domain-containing protein [Steroidobacteraceae bacterium]